MSGKQSKTTISRPKCATVLRFWNTDVRKTKQNNDFTISEQKRAKKKRRICCAGQAKHDFETFYEKSKNRASAIGVSDFTFLYQKSRRFKYQKRRFRLRGVSKSSRSEVIKKSIQNEVDQSKSSELAETSSKKTKKDTTKCQKVKIKKENYG